MPFKVYGHTELIEKVKQTIQQAGDTGLSFLFHGQNGIGKRKSAEHLFAYFSCESQSPKPCSSCRQCRMVERKNHPDLIILEPEGKSGTISINSIRDMMGRINRFRPMEGRYRWIIIDDADRMERSAQNSLLKTLEEPPGRNFFFLITSRPWNLYVTIRSRTIQVYFNNLDFENFKNVMDDLSIPVSREEYDFADGSPGTFMMLFRDREKLYRDVKHFYQVITGQNGNVSDAWESIREYCYSMSNIENFLSLLHRESLKQQKKNLDRDGKKLNSYYIITDVIKWHRELVNKGVSPFLIATSLVTKLYGVKYEDY